MARGDFEAYEAMILSEQIPAEDVPKLLRDNPEFDAYYCQRRGLNEAAA